MNTQTHVIMGALLMGRPVPRLAWAGAAGGMLPDIPMYVAIAGSRAQGHSLGTIFDEFYWRESWQIANAIGHNIPLWAGLSVIAAIAMGRLGGSVTSLAGRLASAYRKATNTALLFAISFSALIHSLIDLAVHRNDGHMHFWPFSQWRFESPVSYWDPAHYGVQFTVFEAVLGLLLAALLFRRYANKGLRIAIALAMLAYLAVPVFFFFNHHGT